MPASSSAASSASGGLDAAAVEGARVGLGDSKPTAGDSPRSSEDKLEAVELEHLRRLKINTMRMQDWMGFTQEGLRTVVAESTEVALAILECCRRMADGSLSPEAVQLLFAP